MLYDLLDLLPASLPLVATVAAAGVVLWVAHRVLLGGKRALPGESQQARQVGLVLLAGVALVLCVLALPVPQDTRNQLLSLVGLVTSAVIALASTTFVANTMAGFMLRTTGAFHTGDYLRAGEHFGRVTERGLLHTELQTEDRDLTTLPNLHLITHPYTVVRSSGTIVSCELSLGYDVHHARVEPLLKAAARQVDLEEPFVRVMSLGDFSVVYRVSGLLKETKHLLTARSRLHAEVLDTLHGNGVEIMSPGFVVQRPQPDGPAMIPEHVRTRGRDEAAPAAETLAFDKADAAEARERERLELHRRLREVMDASGHATGDERVALEATRAALVAQIAALDVQDAG